MVSNGGCVVEGRGEQWRFFLLKVIVSNGEVLLNIVVSNGVFFLLEGRGEQGCFSFLAKGGGMQWCFFFK